MKSATRLLLCAAALTAPLLAKPDLVTFGSFPYSATPYPITAAADGNLYGISYAFNGSSGIFRVAPDGGYKVIHNFPRVLVTVFNRTGSVPASDVVLATDGYVYGLTGTGGLLGRGVLFRMRPDGKDYNTIDIDPSTLPAGAIDSQFVSPSDPTGFPSGPPLIEGPDHSFYTTMGRGTIIHIGRDGVLSLVLRTEGSLGVLVDPANPLEVIVTSQNNLEFRAQRVNLTTGTPVGNALVTTLPSQTRPYPVKWTPSGLVYFQPVDETDRTQLGDFLRLNLDGTVTTLSRVTSAETPYYNPAWRVLDVLDDGTVYFSAGATDTRAYGHTVLALTPGGEKRIIAGFPDSYVIHTVRGPGDSLYSFTTGSTLLLPHDDATTWSPNWLALSNSFHYDTYNLPRGHGSFFQISPSGATLNAAPVATQDLAKTKGANIVFISPLSNDRDPDQNALIFTGAGPASTGQLDIQPGTSPVLTLVPQDGGVASSIIPYKIADSTGASSTGTILVHGNSSGKYADSTLIIRKQPFTISVNPAGRFTAILPDGLGSYLPVAGNLDARDTGIASAVTRSGKLVKLVVNLSSTAYSPLAFTYTITNASGTPLTGRALRK